MNFYEQNNSADHRSTLTSGNEDMHAYPVIGDTDASDYNSIIGMSTIPFSYQPMAPLNIDGSNMNSLKQKRKSKSAQKSTKKTSPNIVKSKLTTITSQGSKKQAI